jgi:HTH-type transcriptional regulator / antitoxin HipB
MDLIGHSIKQARKDRSLTQEELGKMIGFQRAQISRLKNSEGNLPMETLPRVFTAVKAKVKFRVDLSYQIEK